MGKDKRCGNCGKRTRKIIGAIRYTFDEKTNEWTNLDGETIDDADIDKHHFSITAKALTKEGIRKIKEFMGTKPL
jgi:hypothetical protein